MAQRIFSIDQQLIAIKCSLSLGLPNPSFNYLPNKDQICGKSLKVKASDQR